MAKNKHNDQKPVDHSSAPLGTVQHSPASGANPIKQAPIHPLPVSAEKENKEENKEENNKEENKEENKENKEENNKEENKSDKVKSFLKRVPRILLGSLALASFFYFAGNLVKSAGAIVNNTHFSFKTIRPFLSTISPRLVVSAISAFVASAVSLFTYFVSFKNIAFDRHILRNIKEKLNLKDFILAIPVIGGLFLQFNNLSVFSKFNDFRPAALVGSVASFIKNSFAKILPKNFREYVGSISGESFTNLFAAVSFPWIISKFHISEKSEKSDVIKKEEAKKEKVKLEVESAEELSNNVNAALNQETAKTQEGLTKQVESLKNLLGDTSQLSSRLDQELTEAKETNAELQEEISQLQEEIDQLRGSDSQVVQEVASPTPPQTTPITQDPNASKGTESKTKTKIK